MLPIEMVDLRKQYLRIKSEIDEALMSVLDSSQFVQGPAVRDFEERLGEYTECKHVVSCANGTDALVAALMSIGVGAGDEVITVPFTFISSVEAILLVGAKPVFVDVCNDTFNMDANRLEDAITVKTKAVVPVHLFGQCADMEQILEIAARHNLKVVEDACQAVGAEYTFSDGRKKQAGTMGDIGCLSFFPSKNLGCYGDGGALLTNDDVLYERLQMLCHHGSKIKYRHEIVGFNSRLDTLQAAILNIKLNHLDEYIEARCRAAEFYAEKLQNVEWLELPATSTKSTHTFHQFTLKVKDNRRNQLSKYLKDRKIPTAIYYPTPAHLQPAYLFLGYLSGSFPVAETLAKSVLSLPMHTELTEGQLQYICDQIVNYKAL